MTAQRAFSLFSLITKGLSSVESCNHMFWIVLNERRSLTVRTPPALRALQGAHSHFKRKFSASQAEKLIKELCSSRPLVKTGQYTLHSHDHTTHGSWISNSVLPVQRRSSCRVGRAEVFQSSETISKPTGSAKLASVRLLPVSCSY